MQRAGEGQQEGWAGTGAPDLPGLAEHVHLDLKRDRKPVTCLKREERGGGSSGVAPQKALSGCVVEN